MAVAAQDHLLGRQPVLTAIAGASVIAFSAILVRLADVTPETAAVFRCLYALPLLGGLALLERRRYGPRPRRDRLLGMFAGALFSADLICWHHAIHDVGAGLATVLGNLQVVLVAFLAWGLLKERPSSRTAAAVPVVLIGAVLISGLFESGAFGRDPGRGTLFGLATTLAYAGFILVLRLINTDIRRPAGPLFDATATSAVISAVVGASYGGSRPAAVVAGPRLADPARRVEPGRRLAADLDLAAAAARRAHQPAAADPAGGERRARRADPRRGPERPADPRRRGDPRRRRLRVARRAAHRPERGRMTGPERPVLVAPDSFKGTLRATEVAAAIGRGLERAGLVPPDLLPGRRRRRGHARGAAAPRSAARPPARACTTRSGAQITAGFGLIEDGGTAIVEMADGVAGSRLVAEAERDAWAASTYGTGELIAAAVEAGAAVVLVAVGGSGDDRRRRGRDRGDRGRRRPAAARGSSCCATCARRGSAPRRCSGRRRAPTPAMVTRLEERLDDARRAACRATPAACR